MLVKLTHVAITVAALVYSAQSVYWISTERGRAEWCTTTTASDGAISMICTREVRPK